MRTTAEFPDDLFRELKSLAALRGISLKELLKQAVQHELANASKPTVVRDSPSFPVLDSQEPGKLNLKNTQIDDLLT